MPIDLTVDGKIIGNVLSPLRLDVASGTFMGIEEHIFRILADTARRGSAASWSARRRRRATTAA